ncbi:hypothetical protein L6R46_16330 [Myxococcota bacterium]|nr:hypothetical protein [Myxococcota bacterium]
MVLLLLLLSCAPTNLAVPLRDGLLSVNPTSLSFGEVGWARVEERSLRLQNDGFATTTLSLDLSGLGFSVDRAGLTLGAGESQTITLRYSPQSVEPSDGALRLVEPGRTLEVSLRGETALDGDGDGADASAWGGPDCDDLDPDVFPGAAEGWYDGQDQDCDGGSDFDQDGDGVERQPEGRDCDDTDPDVIPGATERWYDDIDQDCDGGSDFDQDRDGVDAAPRGLDCDDTDDDVFPGRVEIWYDGQDQDCSGGSDFDQDGDGAERQPEGDDCDDEDAARAPSLPERPDDGVDQDCDGEIDEAA